MTNQALDRTQVNALATRLRDITGWAAEALDDLICRQVSRDDNERPTRERPLAFHQPASDLATDILGCLRTWAHTICETQHLAWPGEQRIAGWAHWLNRHLIDLARHDQALAAYDEITDCHQRLLRMIDIPSPPEFVGPCQSDIADLSCEGVYCERGKVTFDCGTCGVPIDIPAVRAATAETLGDLLFTKQDLRTALIPFTRKPVARSTIDTWILRGRLPDRAGKYRLSDALTLIPNENRRVS